MLSTPVFTAVAPSDFIEVHAPCLFHVYLDWCRPLVAGSVAPKFSAPFCLFASDIHYYLFIDILYFFLLLTSVPFIRHAMESCFMALLPFQEATIYPVNLRHSSLFNRVRHIPRNIMSAPYPASPLSFLCFFFAYLRSLCRCSCN